jgi:glycine/D-amino acid oxidase-like deaminating enzyme
VNPSVDVVVVGGGLVGAACAFELAHDGHTVTLFDRHDVGRATDAGAGILSPETYGGAEPAFLDLADLAGEHYRALVPALAEVGAPDPRYDVCGTLRVGFRGHGANGLLLGPVTGRVVADLVSGRLPPIDLADFSPARFT